MSVFRITEAPVGRGTTEGVKGAPRKKKTDWGKILMIIIGFALAIAVIAVFAKG